jgi:hypothetical protein
LDRASGRVAAESWILNDLPFDLAGGYLLYIDPRLQDPIRADGVPYRVAGMDVRAKDGGGKPIKWLGSEKVPPATNVVALRFGGLKSQARTTGLGGGEKGEYATVDQEYVKWSNLSNRPAKGEPVIWTLWHHQVYDWADAINGTIIGRLPGGMDVNWSAALLASTRNLYLHTRKEADFDLIGTAITMDGVPNVDITHWLTRGSAVLLLLAERPGPATLHVDGEPKLAREGRTLYRVRVPVTYTGNPPRASEASAPDKLPGEVP